MQEAARVARNLQRLGECHVAFADRLSRVLSRLDAASFRPRIQHAWRSVAEQAALKAGGTSKLTWGYHNCTAPDGTPESLAADVLDDDYPLASRPIYLLRLATHAREQGLSTGITWGLPAALRHAVIAAMESEDEPPAGLKLGWDPTHVEWVGITVAAAKSGVRPAIETIRRH